MDVDTLAVAVGLPHHPTWLLWVMAWAYRKQPTLVERIKQEVQRRAACSRETN